MHFNRLLTATAVAALIGVSPQIAAAQVAAPAKAAASTTTTTTTAPAASPAAPSPAATAAPTVATTTAAAKPVAPAGDIIETARASGQFTTFIKAADATNLTTVLKTNKNLTVFAPTDAAFAALPPGKLDALMADKVALQKVLTHHVINASVDSSKIAGKKGPVTSVANDQIELDGSEGALKADNATIVQADVRATNGILHVVDQVLTPGAAGASVAASGTAAAASTTETAPAASTTTTTATGAKPAVSSTTTTTKPAK